MGKNRAVGAVFIKQSAMNVSAGGGLFSYASFWGLSGGRKNYKKSCRIKGSESRRNPGKNTQKNAPKKNGGLD